MKITHRFVRVAAAAAALVFCVCASPLQAALAQPYRSEMPDNARLNSYVKYANRAYSATDKGILLSFDHYEDAYDTAWDKGGVNAMIWWNAQLVFGQGKQLFAGSIEEPETWQAVPDSAFAGGPPKGEWQGFISHNDDLIGITSDGIFITTDGQHWKPLEAGEGLQPLAVGAGETLWLVVRDGGGAFRIGQSTDLKQWSWSELLPEGFEPQRGIFAVVGDSTAVLAGKLVNGGYGILTLNRQGRRLVAQLALAEGSHPISVWETPSALWAALPNGDIVASQSRGRNWAVVARQPLGAVGLRAAEDTRYVNFFVVAATQGSGYLVLDDHNAHQALEDSPVAVAWQEIRAISPAIAPLPQIDPLPGNVPLQIGRYIAQDGTRLFVSGFDKAAGVLAADAGGSFRPFALNGMQINDLAALDGELIVAADYNRRLFTLNTRSGEVLSQVPPSSPLQQFRWVRAIDGEFFAMEGGPDGSRLLRRSPGEKEWRVQVLPFYLASLVKHKGRYYAATDPHGILSSDNLEAWQYTPLEGDMSSLPLLASAGDRLFYIRHESDYDNKVSNLTVLSSADGSDWTMLAPLQLPDPVVNGKGVAFDGKRYWILYTDGAYVSDDAEAKSWRRVNLPLLGGISPVWALPDGRVATVQGGRFVAVGESLPLAEAAAAVLSTPQGQGAQPATAQLLAATDVAYKQRRERKADEAKYQPKLVPGAPQMAKAFYDFERLYVAGASRSDLWAAAQRVHSQVRIHAPRHTDAVDAVLALLILQLEINDLRMAADLADSLPGFRKQVQSMFGNEYSKAYWRLQKAQGRVASNAAEPQVDVMRLLLAVNNSGSNRYPGIPANYPVYDRTLKRSAVPYVDAQNTSVSVDMLEANLLKGMAGAARDRDSLHALKFNIEASEPMRHVWLLATYVLWPHSGMKSYEEVVNLPADLLAKEGSALSANEIVFAAHSANDTEKYNRYRQMAIALGVSPHSLDLNTTADVSQLVASQIKRVNAELATLNEPAGSPRQSAQVRRLHAEAAAAFEAKDYAKAISLFERTLNEGDKESLLLLAGVYLMREQSGEDYTKGVELLKQAKEAGVPGAELQVQQWADALTAMGINAYVENAKAVEKIRFYLNLAEELGGADKLPDPSMAYMLAAFYFSYLQSDADYREGVRRTKEALSGGNTRITEVTQDMIAQFAGIGREYYTRRQAKRAVQMWEAGAEFGDGESMSLLADLYIMPFDIADDLERALTLTKAAIVAGYTPAVEQLQKFESYAPLLRLKTEVRRKAGTEDTERIPLYVRLAAMRQNDDIHAGIEPQAEPRERKVAQIVDNGILAYESGRKVMANNQWERAVAVADAQALFLVAAYHLADLSMITDNEGFDEAIDDLKDAAARRYAPAVEALAQIQPLLAGAKQELAAAQDASPSVNRTRIAQIMEDGLKRNIAASLERIKTEPVDAATLR